MDPGADIPGIMKRLALAVLVGGTVHCASEEDAVEMGVTSEALTTPNGTNWIVPPRPPARTSAVFADAYVAPFASAGWGVTEAQSTTTKIEGASSLAVTVQSAWGAYGAGVAWAETPYSGASQTEVTFAFNAGPSVHAGIDTLHVAIDDDDAATPTPYVLLKPYLVASGPVAPSTWYRVRIPLAAINPNGRPIRRLLIANRSTLTNVPFFVDDLRFGWTDPVPTERAVYSDAAAPGFAVGGWSVTNASDPFRTVGSSSNRASFTGSYGALTFVYDWNQPALPVADYTTVSFDVSTGTGAVPAAASALRVGLDYSPTKVLSAYVAGGLQPNTWHHVTIPVADLATGPIRTFTLKNESTSSFPLWIDHVRFETDHVPPPLRDVPGLSLARLEGRWDRAQASAPRAAYPGARAMFRFTGTGLTLRLTEIKSYKSATGTSEWSTYLDGAPYGEVLTQSSAATELTQDYVVASGLSNATHQLELVRRSEAEFGSTRFVSATVAGGTMLPAPARRTRRIEFVGDSNMAGYGIDGTRPCSHTAANENWERAFPNLVASRFDAETEAAVHSGKGVFYNSTRTDTVTLGVLYPRSVPSEPASTYAASQFAAQAVVILAGGNDYAYREDGDYPSVAQVQGAYDALVGQVRAAHPGATIVATNSPSISDWYPYYPGTQDSVMVRTKVLTAIQNVVNARRSAGDTAIWFYDNPEVGNEQLMGCDYHPSPALQQTIATGVGNYLASKLGW